jgi:hypothetical protein
LGAFMSKETIDISAELNDAFYKNKDFKVGSVLMYDYEGSKTNLKIVRLNRSKKVCLVKEIKLYTTKEWEQLNEK